MLKDTCEIERMPLPSVDVVKFLGNNIQWPRGVHFADVDQARAVAMFVIDIDGSITNIKIVKHIAKPFDDEVIRVLKKCHAGNQD